MTIQYESNYYGVSTLGDSLMHHGIKGQKWGVRRYQNPDGTYTDAGAKRRAKYLTSEGGLTKKGARKFRKEYKKLQKLQDRADVNKQRELADTYNKRAKESGKLALGAGLVGGAIAAIDPISRVAGDRHDANAAAYRAANDKLTKMRLNAARAGISSQAVLGVPLRDGKPIASGKNFAAQMYQNQLEKMDKASRRVSLENGALFTIADTGDKLRTYGSASKVAAATAGAVAAVSAGAAIYNKVQAHAAQKRTTELGHDKAVQDVKKQMERMHDMFGDVKITDLQKKKAS